MSKRRKGGGGRVIVVEGAGGIPRVLKLEKFEDEKNFLGPDDVCN